MSKGKIAPPCWAAWWLRSRPWAWRHPPQAQEKKIKIGVVYDLTGPFAGGGSELHYLGAKIMID